MERRVSPRTVHMIRHPEDLRLVSTRSVFHNQLVTNALKEVIDENVGIGAQSVY